MKALIVKVMYKFIRHPLRSIQMLSPRKIRHFFYFLKEEGPGFVSKRIDESMQGIAIRKTEYDIITMNRDKQYHEYEELIFPIQDRTLISIIIPVFNEFSYTYNCLKSILQNTGQIYSYEIIVADDGSTDDTVRLSEKVKNITIIKNEKNLRFLKNCNHAAGYAKGKYIIFLNNDTQVQKNWLSALVNQMENREDIGLCGSKLVYGDGRLQEAGGIIWKDASAWNYGNGSNPDAPEYNYVKEVDYISGAAIMVRRDLWNRLGGFDESFAPAYYEDVDLACQIRECGYKVVYQPDSVVLHFEGISNGTDVSSGQKAYQMANQKVFYKKWKQVLEKEHYNNGEKVFLARDCSGVKKMLLVVDHYVPRYDKDAGSRSMFYYLKLFTEMGYHIKFIGDDFYKDEPYTSALQQMGIEVLYGNYYCANWKEWIRANGKYFDYIILGRPHISVKYMDLARKVSNAKIIYFGYDLHYLREMRQYELTGREQALKDSAEWKKTELELMQKADISYYFSHAEIEEIAKMDAAVNARRVPINIYDQVPEISYIPKSRRDIIFVGGFAHPPNSDAVKSLGEMIMPMVWKKYPDIILHVVGSEPPSEIKDLASEHLIVHGFVSDENLEKMYQSVRVAVIPLRFGAGIKGKVIEAMMRGIPVITTSIGIEGIEGAEKIVKVSDEREKLAEYVINLYENEVELADMSVREHQYVKDNYSVQEAVNILRKDFYFDEGC